MWPRFAWCSSQESSREGPLSPPVYVGERDGGRGNGARTRRQGAGSGATAGVVVHVHLPGLSRRGYFDKDVELPVTAFLGAHGGVVVARCVGEVLGVEGVASVQVHASPEGCGDGYPGATQGVNVLPGP